MNSPKPKHTWISKKLNKNAPTIDCPEYDTYKDFKMEPTGHYVLIKVDFAVLRINVAVCNKKHTIVKIFSGRKAQDIYHAIFQHEQSTGVEWFKDKSHIAYLGKELKKAELALSLGNSAYFQE